MADRNELLSWRAADARRRVHIRRAGDGAAWSFGPRGVPFDAPTPGDALNEAIDRLNGEPAVIIYEGRAR